MGFGELCWITIWGSHARFDATFWAQIGAKFGYLGYLEATALLLAAKLGDLDEAICQILFGHVIGFASRNAFPPAGPRFKWVSASYVGSIWGSGAAILWVCWGHWHRLGINFGHLGAMMMLCGLSSGDTTPASPNTTPKYTSKTLSPMALEKRKAPPSRAI